MVSLGIRVVTVEMLGGSGSSVAAGAGADAGLFFVALVGFFFGGGLGTVPVPKSEAKKPVAGTVFGLGWCFISHILTFSSLSSSKSFGGLVINHRAH